jgi:hypothetical protein
VTRPVTLMTALVYAPLVGIRKRWPNVAHAVEIDELIRAWPSGSPLPVAACGVRGLRLISDDVNAIIPWPIPARGGPMERCRECWVVTGSKRPRARWATVEQSLVEQSRRELER